MPVPGPGRIRVVVQACGLNPADWALCRGLFAGELPRGIGIEVSGTVDAIGDGVTDITNGDLVLGTADWAGGPTAGAADRAVMDHWTPVPAGLDLTQAAALPMALETAYRSLAQLGLSAEHTILIHGAGSTIGYAAVQIARIRGARVIATAGDTYAQRLRDLGATVTAYGDGMVERVPPSPTARSTSSSTPRPSEAPCPTSSRSPAATRSTFSRSPTSPPRKSSEFATASTKTGPNVSTCFPSSRSLPPTGGSPSRSREPSRSRNGGRPSRSA